MNRDGNFAALAGGASAGRFRGAAVVGFAFFTGAFSFTGPFVARVFVLGAREADFDATGFDAAACARGSDGSANRNLRHDWVSTAPGVASLTIASSFVFYLDRAFVPFLVTTLTALAHERPTNVIAAFLAALAEAAVPAPGAWPTGDAMVASALPAAPATTADSVAEAVMTESYEAHLARQDGRVPDPQDTSEEAVVFRHTLRELAAATCAVVLQQLTVAVDVERTKQVRTEAERRRRLGGAPTRDAGATLEQLALVLSPRPTERAPSWSTP
ncbi:hypothetical protein M885DRAFT_577548 [Pelagophyceae sp. CCMP2097]|nr:hypothetical protein M885DRAFT_577547 [Pelagophyceae sp. CCMP2097]KAJ1446503.1 hypothetical protein M885DRAFT_577548 [Pelagophyceae sp. CCMP2097]